MAITVQHAIATTLGTVLLQIPNGSDYAFVEFGGDAGFFRVRGVQQTGSMSFNCANGAWVLNTDTHTDDEIKAVVAPVVIAWLEANPDVIEEVQQWKRGLEV